MYKYLYEIKKFFPIIFIILIVSGCNADKKSDNFEKRNICYEDAVKKGGDTPKFVFYSPAFDTCVEYFCMYQKMNPEEFDMDITPGCEISDFYTNKLYKTIGCANEEECKNKLDDYK